jgi:hypothetical protein
MLAAATRLILFSQAKRALFGGAVSLGFIAAMMPAHARDFSEQIFIEPLLRAEPYYAWLNVSFSLAEPTPRDSGVEMSMLFDPETMEPQAYILDVASQTVPGAHRRCIAYSAPNEPAVMDTYNTDGIVEPNRTVPMKPEIRTMMRELFDDVRATIDAAPGKEISEKIGYGVIRYPPKSTFDVLNRILSTPGGCNLNDPEPDQPQDAFFQKPAEPFTPPSPASASSHLHQAFHRR